MNALLSQKINIFDFLQSKAQSMQGQTYYGQANQLMHHHHHSHQQQQSQHLSTQPQSYPDELKKTYSTFSPLIHQETNNSYQQLNNCSTEMFRNYKQNERAMHFTSPSATQSHAESTLESLKETQLRISESCNLVNEST